MNPPTAETVKASPRLLSWRPSLGRPLHEQVPESRVVVVIAPDSGRVLTARAEQACGKGVQSELQEVLDIERLTAGQARDNREAYQDSLGARPFVLGPPWYGQ